MLKRKYYPFERNNYYYGKLLTSRDFQNEQEYVNGKRRFVNRTLHGTGIVCGLGVLKGDDSSIVLQSGFALDAGGREIVVAETQVIKLATIDGYHELQTNCAYLGIEYKESQKEPVYSVMGSQDEESRRYNALKEDYRLYLMDEETCSPMPQKEDQYINHVVIYQDEDIKITQSSPAYIAMGKYAKLRVIIEKLSHRPTVCSLKYQVQADGFVNHEFEVKADNLCQEYGEKNVLEYELIPEAYIFNGNEIAVTMTGFEVKVSQHTYYPQRELRVFIKPIEENALECIVNNSYSTIMDVELEEGYDEKIMIAKINLLTSASAAMIDTIEGPPYAQYVYNSRQLMALNQINEYLVKPSEGHSRHVLGSVSQGSADTAGSSDEVRQLTSGVVEISLGNGGEAGKVYLSDEIMHGLGEGAVYVNTGIEYLNRDADGNAKREEIILGENSLFEVTDENQEKPYQLETAVKLLPSRGTFIIALRPKAKVGKMSLRVRWFAFKPEDLQQRVVRRDQAGCIMVSPDTIIVEPKGNVHINTVFINMPEEALTYTLLDTEGGKIENNGMYTAPNQEGVYEIRIACISDPEIYTQAFAIVTQRQEGDNA
jgi:hypothetical protein